MASRDEARAQARDVAADARDDVAEARDRQAGARDQVADTRDAQAQLRDAASRENRRSEAGRLVDRRGRDERATVEADRRRAATDREETAAFLARLREHERSIIADRRAAAEDRRAAAEDRRAAARDRELAGWARQQAAVEAAQPTIQELAAGVAHTEQRIAEAYAGLVSPDSPATYERVRSSAADIDAEVVNATLALLVHHACATASALADTEHSIATSLNWLAGRASPDAARALRREADKARAASQAMSDRERELAALERPDERVPDDVDEDASDTQA